MNQMNGAPRFCFRFFWVQTNIVDQVLLSGIVPVQALSCVAYHRPGPTSTQYHRVGMPAEGQMVRYRLS